MSLFDRNKPTQLGKAQPSPIEQKALQPEYDLTRVGNTPHDMVTMLVALQSSVYHQTILERLPQKALMAHAKRLSKQYTADRIKRAILRAAQTSPAPFSFKYVEQMIIREMKDGNVKR